MRFHHYLTQFFSAHRPIARSLPCKRKPSRRLCLEALEDRTVPAIFMVSNTLDGGPGSLRQAILDAENTPNTGVPDEIHFNIPGSGVHTINPSSTFGFSSRSLPEILESVIIDGYTQPGASPNTLAVGDNAVLKIEINGSNVPGTPLFHFSGDNSTVRGLAITHVHGTTISIGGFGPIVPNHITIAGNFLGTADGLTYQGDDGPAIFINTGNNTVIGGDTPADRNVIAPGAFVPTASIGMGSGTGNLIQGNYIGVNKDGTAALQSPNGGFAIDIGQDSGSNTVTGNVIFATLTGIRLTQGSTGHNVIRGNFIGTNATGTAGLGAGQFGIDVQTSNETIRGNVISGLSTGISISPQGVAANEQGATIQGNKIGTDVTGALPIPNSGHGIILVSSPAGGTIIGGTLPGDGNTIAFNSGGGVCVNSGSGCSILGNSIFANGNLGINLNGPLDGFTGPVTPNDAGDSDTGANGVQNFPVLTSVVTNNGTTTISGSLNSAPNTTFHIEFFANDVADPSGFGEGKKMMEAIAVTTNASGDATFTVNLDVAVGVGQLVSATATDPNGNTSEFAAVVAVTGTNNNVPIITTLNGQTSGSTGDQFFFTGDFSDPDPDTWTGTVNFGDGSGDQPLTLNPDKTFDFDHIFTALGTYTVTVTIADNHSGFDSDSLTVTITDNTPPVITQFSGPGTLVLGQVGFFGGTFVDPDASDTWTATANFGDGTGDHPMDTFSDKTFGNLRGFAAPGTYTVTVTLADNHGGSDTRSLTVTVKDNTPPVITQFSGPGTLVLGQVGFFGGTFIDPDTSDTWTATANFGDGTGDHPMDTFSDKTFGNLRSYAVPGTYTVTVTLADNHGGSDTRSLTVTVTDNTSPVAINDTVLLNTTASRTINVLANDSDPNGDPLTVTSVTQPASGHGIVTINNNGTLNYRQMVYVKGTESFTYTISDGHGGSATATVTVTVSLPASVGIDMLIGQVRESNLNQARKTILIAKLNAAQNALTHHHPQAAAIHLASFALKVRAFKQAHILTASLADLWLAEVQSILRVLGFPPH